MNFDAIAIFKIYFIYFYNLSTRPDYTSGTDINSTSIVMRLLLDSFTHTLI